MNEHHGAGRRRRFAAAYALSIAIHAAVLLLVAILALNATESNAPDADVRPDAAIVVQVEPPVVPGTMPVSRVVPRRAPPRRAAPPPLPPAPQRELARIVPPFALARD